MVRLWLDYQIHPSSDLCGDRRSPFPAEQLVARYPGRPLPWEATPRPQGARDDGSDTEDIEDIKDEVSDRRPHGLSLQRDHDRLKEWSRAAARSAWALVSLSGMSRGTPRDRYSVEYI
jgi:hypothetical protein